jgi:hypothetical protein
MNIHKLDWLDSLTILLCCWFLFYPRPYELLFTIILLLPIVGLVVHGHAKPSLASLVSITSNDKNGTNYNVADFIVLPAIIILLRMLLDFEIENFVDLLIKGLIVFVVLLVIILFFYRDLAKDNTHTSLIYFAVLGNLMIYSFAVVYGINCVYDKTKPEIHRVVITDKSIYSGKHTTYYFKIESWNNNGQDKISVSKDQYNRRNVGDTVSVDEKKGLLKIPWHYIE